MVCFAWTPAWISRMMLYISEVSVFFVRRTTWSISSRFEVIIRLTCAHFLFHMRIISSTCCIPYKYGRYSIQNVQWPVNQTEIVNWIWTFASYHLFSPPLTLSPYVFSYSIHIYYNAATWNFTKWRWCVFMAQRLSRSSRAFGFCIRAPLLTAAFTRITFLFLSELVKYLCFFHGIHKVPQV